MRKKEEKHVKDLRAHESVLKAERAKITVLKDRLQREKVRTSQLSQTSWKTFDLLAGIR